MIFITGPLYSGKREYARLLLGCTREELAQRAVWDVQGTRRCLSFIICVPMK